MVLSYRLHKAEHAIYELSQQSASKRTCQLPSYAREVYRKTQVNLGHGTTCGTARGRKLRPLKTLYFSRQLADTPHHFRDPRSIGWQRESLDGNA
jgi:hypothetical protein